METIGGLNPQFVQSVAPYDPSLDTWMNRMPVGSLTFFAAFVIVMALAYFFRRNDTSRNRWLGRAILTAAVALAMLKSDAIAGRAFGVLRGSYYSQAGGFDEIVGRLIMSFGIMLAAYAVVVLIEFALQALRRD